jgi:hypothetical protein
MFAQYGTQSKYDAQKDFFQLVLAFAKLIYDFPFITVG